MNMQLMNSFVPTDKIVGKTSIELARVFVFTHLFGPVIALPMAVYLFVMSSEQNYQLYVMLGGIFSFWVLPPLLKATGNMTLVALLSFQGLCAASLFGTLHYGGFSSPFLPWLIVSLLLGFFYLSKQLLLVLSLFVANIAIFMGFVFLNGFSELIAIDDLKILGWLSIVAAATYMAWMALYYSRMVAMRSELEFEADRYNKISQELHGAKRIAENLNKERSHFFSKMSHELRTPLNSIVGYSELLEEDLEDQDEPNKQWLADVRRINSAGKLLMSLVGEVLDTDKLGSSDTTMNVTRFSLQDWCQEISTTAHPLMEKNGNTFKLNCKKSTEFVNNDQQKLTQIALNLLSNAAKFTSNGLVQMTVQIEEGPVDKRLHISVADQGIGIEEDSIPKLFASYMQADETISNNYGGTGLGLALCRKFAVLLGGEISVESTIGKGSTFTVEIPADLPIDSEKLIVKETELQSGRGLVAA